MIAELSLVDGESNAANQPEDPAGWEPATFTLALEIMGVAPADYVDASKGLTVGIDCIGLLPKT